MSWQNTMAELTETQRFILALVVHEYARTAAPVGSSYLVEQYHLGHELSYHSE